MGNLDFIQEKFKIIFFLPILNFPVFPFHFKLFKTFNIYINFLFLTFPEVFIFSSPDTFSLLFPY